MTDTTICPKTASGEHTWGWLNGWHHCLLCLRTRPSSDIPPAPSVPVPAPAARAAEEESDAALVDAYITAYEKASGDMEYRCEHDKAAYFRDVSALADAHDSLLARFTALRAHLAAMEQERDRVSEALDIGEDAQLGCTRAAAILSSVGVSDPDGTIVGMVGNAMDLIVSLRAQLAAATQERETVRQETVEACCSAVCDYCKRGMPTTTAIHTGVFVHEFRPSDDNPRGFVWDTCRAGHLRVLLATPAQARDQVRRETVEALAAYAHEAWSGWMRFLFEWGEMLPDGRFTIAADRVARWQRQMRTPYEALPDNEQESDRHEARRILAILSPADGGAKDG